MKTPNAAPSESAPKKSTRLRLTALLLLALICLVIFKLQTPNEPSTKVHLRIEGYDAFANEFKVEQIDKMPRRLYRLGMTESTLLYGHVMDKLNVPDHKGTFIEILVQFLYSTSGFYDKSINGTYFDFNVKKVLRSPAYYLFKERLVQIFNGSEAQLNTHRMEPQYEERREDFNKYLSLSPMDAGSDAFFSTIKDRKLLLVSPFSPLFKQQILSGKLNKLYSNFPNISSVVTYRMGYTFFNNKYGNESNFFVTLSRVCNEIAAIDPNEYDLAVISCGAYSVFVGDCIARKFRKEVMTLGGDLSGYFGVMNTRMKDYYDQKNISYNSSLWVNPIPNEYRPPDYMKIENGCYW